MEVGVNLTSARAAVWLQLRGLKGLLPLRTTRRLEGPGL
jgi:hypothetical protein